MFIHHHLTSCESTQLELKKKLPKNGPFQKLLISTNSQTQGFGRSGKAWILSDQGLAFSFTFPSQKIPTLTSLEIGCLLIKFFETYQVKAYLKWPNDILNHKGEKSGGIILHNFNNYFIVGVGLNLADSPKLQRTAFPAGPLLNSQDELNSFSKTAHIQSDLSSKIYHFLLKSRYANSLTMSNDWKNNCFHLNKQVLIRDHHKEFSGTFKGIDGFGQAILLRTDQSEIKVPNGSLFLVD